jgi:hypothetical protein
MGSAMTHLPVEGSLSNEETVWVLGNILHQAHEFSSWKGVHDPDLMRAVLIALRDALIRFVPPTAEDTDTPARRVLAAFDDDQQEWAQAGVAPGNWRHWEALGFRPGDAGAWERAGVTVEYALHFRSLLFQASWWSSWVQVHDLADDDQQIVVARMFHLIGQAGNLKLGLSQVNKWVERGVPVWDISVWFGAGYTPAKAAAAISKGTTVKQVSRQAELVPGPSWIKVKNAAVKHNWKVVSKNMFEGEYVILWSDGKRASLHTKFGVGGKFKYGRLSCDPATVMTCETIRSLEEMLTKWSERNP